MPSLKLSLELSDETGDIYKPLYLYFESNDCSGKPHVGSSLAHHMFGFGDQYFYGEPIKPSSYRWTTYYYNDDSNNCLTRPVPNLLNYRVTVETVDPPFKVQVALHLSFENEPAHPGKWTGLGKLPSPFLMLPFYLLSTA